MRNKVKGIIIKSFQNLPKKTHTVIFIIVGLCINYVRHHLSSQFIKKKKNRLSSQGNLKKFDKSF